MESSVSKINYNRQETLLKMIFTTAVALRIFDFHNNHIRNKKQVEWMFDKIRIEKIILAPIWATKIFSKVSAVPDVRHCPKLQFCATSRKTNDATFRKLQKP